MNGYELAEKAKANLPGLKILLTSGFSDTAVARNGQARFTANLLSKPYSRSVLAQRIRSLLGEAEAVDSNLQGSGQPTKQQTTGIAWVDELSIGIAPIDRDHKELVGLLNRALQLEQNKSRLVELGAILDELMEYTRYHFQREEAVMKACGYPGAINHCQVHQLLIRRVEERQRHVREGKFTAAQLVDFLKNWLVDHIQGMDKALVPYCEGKSEFISKTLDRFDTDRGSAL